MPRIEWDIDNARLYETGVDRGVLYPMGDEGAYGDGVPWNGLKSVSESPSGAEETVIYANNSKYGSLLSNEDFAGTIEAYTYPDEFAACDGSKEIVTGVTATQQERKIFGLSYRTIIGNDNKGLDYGYKIHIVYGAKASPSQKQNNTISESPEAITMSWEFKTVPVKVEGMKPTAHIVIDSTKLKPDNLKKIEDKLYGDDNSGKPSILMPAELKTLLSEA